MIGQVGVGEHHHRAPGLLEAALDAHYPRHTGLLDVAGHGHAQAGLFQPRHQGLPHPAGVRLLVQGL